MACFMRGSGRLDVVLPDYRELQGTKSRLQQRTTPIRSREPLKIPGRCASLKLPMGITSTCEHIRTRHGFHPFNLCSVTPQHNTTYKP
jgi:hypothetical protein